VRPLERQKQVGVLVAIPLDGDPSMICREVSISLFAYIMSVDLPRISQVSHSHCIGLAPHQSSLV
jgi:hypothetical protein